MLIFSPIAVQAEDSVGRDIEYGKLNEFLQLNKNIQSKYASFNTQLKTNKPELKLADVKVSINILGKSEQPIEIAEDGTVILPVLSSELAKQAKLHINQTKGDVSLNMSANINAPKETTLAYRDLFVILDDTNEFAKKMAGMAAWFVPSMDRLKFTFAKPATIEIHSEKKKYTYSTDKDNSIVIKIKSALMKENPQVIFSEVIKTMSPED
jgi:hypothetical protein